MPAPSRLLILFAPLGLAGCPLPEIASCADYGACTTSTGPMSTGTGSEPVTPTDGIQTVTSDGETTNTTGPPPTNTTTGEPDVPEVPDVVSVKFTPDPITLAGFIAVDVVAENADHVRMELPDFAPVDLSKGPGEHFVGSIEILSGLSNGTHEATFVPQLADVEGDPETAYYSVDLPAAGEEAAWDVIPDDGLGQIEALAVLGDDKIVGFGTLFDGNTSRCYVHRRGLDGSYVGADVQLVFPEYDCNAVDIVTADESIYLLAMVTGGDGPRWRLASMTWGGTPMVLRTGVKDEVAHALARNASGKLVACGTGPSPAPLMDTIDGRVWPFGGSTIELDYRLPPVEAPHTFDEIVADCAFAGERLVLGGEVLGKHDQELDPNKPAPPPRKRPFVIEIDGQGEPLWTVAGLGPGNTTQGGVTALAIDEQGRAVVGLYTCEDTCDPEPELRTYEPGGDLVGQVLLPAEVSVPFDVAWSSAGYAVIAGALGSGQSSQFLVQGYVPGDYAPAWTFAKGKQAGLHLAYAVVVAPGVVVGGGFGAGGFPAFAFVHP